MSFFFIGVFFATKNVSFWTFWYDAGGFLSSGASPWPPICSRGVSSANLVFGSRLLGILSPLLSVERVSSEDSAIFFSRSPFRSLLTFEDGAKPGVLFVLRSPPPPSHASSVLSLDRHVPRFGRFVRFLFVLPDPMTGTSFSPPAPGTAQTRPKKNSGLFASWRCVRPPVYILIFLGAVAPPPSLCLLSIFPRAVVRRSCLALSSPSGVILPPFSGRHVLFCAVVGLGFFYVPLLQEETFLLPFWRPPLTADFLQALLRSLILAFSA